MKVLLTGGAGYIGSHTAISLVEAGHEVVVVDDLSNSSPESLRRVSQIVGREIPLVIGDVADQEMLESTMREHKVDAVIHFASLKSPGQSMTDPLKYYRVNIGISISLLSAMQQCGVERLVFSSSAAVYEEPGALLTEDAPSGLGVANPYGRTKAIIESIIRDASVADKALQAAILRYFNPVGAHPSGTIGEDPAGLPNNLFPYMAQVAVKDREELQVFGDDYDTPDGTGIRDYIHVVDLAEGHVAALEALRPGVIVANLGTGRGTSVFEALAAFESVVGKPLPYRVVGRRAGDTACATAHPGLAEQSLGWTAKRSFTQAVQDAWRWQQQNPRGYRD